MSNIASSASGGLELIDEVKKLKHELAKFKPTLLWENPNPTVEFSPQTITLSSNDYDYIDIIHTQNGGDEVIYTRSVKGKNFSLTDVTNDSGAKKISIYARWFQSSQNGLKLIVGNCIWGKEGVETQAKNTWLVPLKIMGYKS